MNLLFLGTSEDVPYMPRLKGCLKHVGSTYLLTEPISTLYELIAYCNKRKVTGILSTRSDVLAKLTYDPNDAVEYKKDGTPKKLKLPSVDNYAGSMFTVGEDTGIELVVVNPLKQLLTVPFGDFMLTRYASKLIAKDNWYQATDFSWEIVTPKTAADYLELFATADLIALDIETVSTPIPAITCVGYCGVWYDVASASYHSHSIVIPCTDDYLHEYIRKFNALPVPKVMQNGKYDIAYLARFNAPVSHWFWDTATMQHCWYSELPKDLGTLAAFYIREARYWKGEAKYLSTDIERYYLYNAKDTWNTANVAMAWILEAPKWAKDNYLMEFPLNYPCHLSELTGVRADVCLLADARRVQEAVVEDQLQVLRVMTDSVGFNPNSPVQVKKLLQVLGCGDLTSSDDASLTKASFRHPLNALILSKITKIRKARKLISTYLDESKLFRGRVLYSLVPHGTDTGRLASREHHFWCGLQIQNIPRGKGAGTVKSYMVADTGFLMAEADFAQAESRGTGYISGDINLIEAVESDRDFHGINASKFFGIPYEEIVDTNGKTINKELRDLSKRTNHGANYNMGDFVMLETMGEANVAKAKRLLGLNKLWSLKQVCQHLLDQFAKTYPRVKNDYQTYVKYQVGLSKMLTGATGWTRYCFGKPNLNKPALNAYVAHCPQSLNAMILNKAYMKVFYEIWLLNHDNFKLCAQVHDSILFQYRIGHEYLIDMVKACMEIPTEVTDISGTTRTMLVPVDINAGLTSWGDKKNE